MKTGGTAFWTVATVAAALLVATFGWSWSLSGVVSQAQTSAQEHARRLALLESARGEDREIVQRLARLEEAVAGVRAGQERLLRTLDNLMQARTSQ